MAEDTHREKAQTAGTLTITMTKVLARPLIKIGSLARLMKLLKKTKLVPAFWCMVASVMLYPMQMNMGITTKPRKKIRLGSMNR